MPNEPKNLPTVENNAFTPAARHNARRYAVQALYQWQLAGNTTIEIESEFTKYHITEQTDLEYFKELLHNIPKQQPEIDQAMQPFLTRSQQDIDPVELAILRLAIYELLKRPDVPYRVIINEALELTKQFGSVEGFKFVNGVLDKVASVTRPHEGKKK